MSPTLYSHPLASYAQKVLVALYEADIEFTQRLVDLGDAEQRAELAGLWPPCKLPVLHDHARDTVIAESTIIIEYLTLHHAGAARLLPVERERALVQRRWDRFFDLHVQTPMQAIVGDRLRGEARRDPTGVDQARAALATAYALLEQRLRGRTWIADDELGLADVSAAPALFYAHEVAPIGEAYPALWRYRERLLARPSYARVLAEAQPYMTMFPR